MKLKEIRRITRTPTRRGKNSRVFNLEMKRQEREKESRADRSVDFFNHVAFFFLILKRLN